MLSPKGVQNLWKFYQIQLKIWKITRFIGYFEIKTLKNSQNFLLSLILAQNPQNWREFFLTFLLALKLLDKFCIKYSKFDYFILKSIKNANFLIILCQNRIFFLCENQFFHQNDLKNFPLAHFARSRIRSLLVFIHFLLLHIRYSTKNPKNLRSLAFLAFFKIFHYLLL